MQDFYKDLALRAPGIFVRSLVRTDTTFDILSKIILAVFVGSSNPVVSTGVDTWNWLTSSQVVLNGVPLWWSLALLGIVFLHGLFRYVHEDKQRVQRERDDFEEKLKAYEDSGKPKVVARKENPGPVSISEDEPYIIDPPEYPTYGQPVTCLAPYSDNDAATPVEIENAQSEYDVVVSYDVRSTTDDSSAAHYAMRIEARVWLVDENGKKVRNQDFYRGTIDVAEDGSWQHRVSGHSAFVGLPKGVYSLYVVDSTVMDGWRGHPRREYRDMYLRVTRR